MKSTLLVILLLTSVSADCQVTKTNFWAVKWVPSAIATPTVPHFRFAVERRWDRLGVNVQAGYSFPGVELTRSDTKTKVGYANRIELRKYGKKSPKRNANFYHGAEAFYYYSKGDAIDEFSKTNDLNNTDYYADEYQYKRNVYGLVYKFGFQFRIKSHFVMEFSTGLGGKVIHNRVFNRDNINHIKKLEQDFHEKIIYENHDLIYPAIPCIFAVGYKF